MMNETVARIVDLMFDNAEMTEEVTALRDEVMNNCQERYSDLVASGMSEDDAVAAVVESLRGMEDVISQYERKTRRAAAAHTAENAANANEGEEAGARNLVFAAEEIHEISLTLVSEDVTLEESDDDSYHIVWDAEVDPQIDVHEEGGVLRIERKPGNWERSGHGKRNAHVYVDGRRANADEAEEIAGKVMDDVGSLLENIGRSLGRMFQSVRSGFSNGDGVTIQIPENAVPHVRLLTTSGDLSVQNVALADLKIVTTSGDIDVDLDEDEYIQQIELRSTSGDIEVSAFAQEMTAASTSGDVEVEGRCDQLTVSTISGDIDVRADVTGIAFKAVSGDVDMEFDSDELRQINGSTVSGDIDIDLPSGLGAIAINTRTRSGDVTTRYSTNGHGPTVGGEVSSISGDITIR